MSNRPLVSVIIPAYNRETLISRCLFSVVNQTLENIEIIIVDDGSTDNTVEIIKNYLHEYKNIIFIQQENQGAAKARNRGISVATGEYITFVDSDDYIEIDAFEKMYFKALECEADMLCAPLYLISNETCRVTGRYHGIDNNSEDIIYAVTSNLYNKFIKKTFLDETKLLIPDFIIGEDTAFITALMTRAKNLCYLDYPYYFYELSSNSLSNDTIDRPWIVENTENVRQWLIKNSNPDFFEILRVMLSKRFIHLYNHNEKYQDKLKKYLIQNKIFYLYAYKTDARYKEIREKVEYILNKSEKLIPLIIYINGFANDFNLENRIDYLSTNLFCDKSKVLVLDRETCDIDKSPLTQMAWNKKDYNLLGQYFAIEHILQTGGVYVGQELTIREKWSMIRNNVSFFALQTNGRFLENVFGGIADNECMKKIKKILDQCTYSSGIFQNTLSIILCQKYNIKKTITIKNQSYEKVSVYNSGTFYLPEYNQISLATCIHTKDLDLLNLYFERTKIGFIEQRKLNNHINHLVGVREHNQKRIKELEQDIKCLKNSVSFKLGRSLTFIPKKIRGGIWCIADHGLSYTIAHTVKKILRRC